MPDPIVDVNGNDLTKSPVIKSIVKSLMGLGNLVTELGKQVKETNSNFEKMQLSMADLAKRPSGKKTKEVNDDQDGDNSRFGRNGDDDDDQLTDDEINAMSQSDFLKLVSKETGKVVDKKVGGVEKKLGDVAKSVSTKNTQAEVTEFMKKHPDLLEWKDEIAELSKENPGLSVSRLYTLAKSENSKKAKELSVKYKDAKVDTDDDGKPVVKFGSQSDDDDNSSSNEDDSVSKFFGLTPTGGGTKSEKNERMTPKQATEDAWAKTMANIPASLRGDDT
jgi:hypothetical protein